MKLSDRHRKAVWTAAFLCLALLLVFAGGWIEGRLSGWWELVAQLGGALIASVPALYIATKILD